MQLLGICFSLLPFFFGDVNSIYIDVLIIPMIGILNGGKTNKIQMEHVYVEAATDYYPSRGAINKNSDIWLELDPIFTQYDFFKELDSVAISTIDPSRLAQDSATGTTNEAGSWVCLNYSAIAVATVQFLLLSVKIQKLSKEIDGLGQLRFAGVLGWSVIDIWFNTILIQVCNLIFIFFTYDFISSFDL